MTAQQAKIEIEKIIEDMNEETLIQVYEYLKSLNSSSQDDQQLAVNLSKILKEDRVVLEKLAK
jgi:hypothetical protein